MTHTRIKEIRTRGGFSQNDEEPSISFIFDHKVENEDHGARREAAVAQSIVMNRHSDPERRGWRAQLWQFFTDGDYDAERHYLGVVRRTPPMGDAQKLCSEAEAVGDEYLKVLGQVPALLEQVGTWAERSGLKVETDIVMYEASFDVYLPEDPTIRGTVGFDIRSDPLRFEFDEGRTAILKALFGESVTRKKALAEDRKERHLKHLSYDQKKRSDTAKMAAQTRKLNQEWKDFQAELAAQPKSPSEVTK